MAAGRLPSLRCVRCRLRTRNRLVRHQDRTARPGCAPQNVRANGSGQPQNNNGNRPVSHKRMFSQCTKQFEQAAGSNNAGQRSPMCKIIQTGHLPPITPDNSLKAINREFARKQRPRKVL